MSSRLLAGRYELLEKIGDGGMAVVYKAKCRVLNRFVAIKILKPEFTKDMKFIENFRRESQSAASLNHPNIVNVYDVGREGNINYIVMELIEGQALSDIINQEGPLEPNRVISIAKQIALALSFAHKNQIIHRDVKPHNIMITNNGIAKITDFGIAKAVNAATIVGQTGTVMGSVHYFSPEQARGGYVDEKSDIYSLGIVIYEMLTGRVPFNADNPVAVAVMHMNEQMVPPSQIVPSVPPELEAVVLKATDKYQTNRYKSADEMYEALDRAAFSMLGFTRQNTQTPYQDKGLDATMMMAAVNQHPPQNRNQQQNQPRPAQQRPVPNSQYKADKVQNQSGMGEDEMAREKKKKIRLNLIKIFAVVLALVCAIPASHFVLTAVENMGKAKEVEVPDLLGETQESAEKELEKLGLKCEIGDKVESNEYDEGRVVSQNPDEGATVKKGQTVKIDISKGLINGEVPNLTGKTLDDAVYTLENAGYKKGKVTTEDSDRPEDEVIDQTPQAGTEAKAGTRINLVISNGADAKEEVETVKMPNLRGLSEDKAKQQLIDSGLTVGKVGEDSSTGYDKGKVMWQEFDAGEELEEGTAVNFNISTGPPEEAGPKTVGIKIDYSQAANEVFYLTVILIDDSGTKTLCSGEQRLKSDGSEIYNVTGQGKGTVTVLFDNNEIIKRNVDFSTGTVS